MCIACTYRSTAQDYNTAADKEQQAGRPHVAACDRAWGAYYNQLAASMATGYNGGQPSPPADSGCAQASKADGVGSGNAPNYGAASTGAVQAPGTGALSDDMSGIMSSLSDMQNRHLAALGIHQGDQQRDTEITGGIENDAAVLTAYLNSGAGGNLALLFSVPFTPPAPDLALDQYDTNLYHASFTPPITYADRVVASMRDFWLQANNATSCQFLGTGNNIALARDACGFLARWRSGPVPDYESCRNNGPVNLAHVDEYTWQGDMGRDDRLLCQSMAAVAEYEILALAYTSGAVSGSATDKSRLIYAAGDALLEAMDYSLSTRLGNRAPSYAARLLNEFAPVFSYIVANLADYPDGALARLQSRLHLVCTTVTDTGVSWSDLPVCTSPSRGW